MRDISVIIPAYNSEDTIKRCVKSVINQSIFNQLEVILINDGSTDSTLEILMDYAKYANVKVIDVANGGPAKARNIGIKTASAKYIGFVDADDYIEEDMYETMLKEMNEDIDLVCCGRRNLYSDNTTKDFINNSNETDPKKFNSTTAYIWDKLFKKDIINQFNIEFPENLSYAEDFYFLTIYKLYAKKMVILPKALYVYNIDQNESITNKYDEKLLDIIKSLREVNNYFINKNEFEKYKDELLMCSVGFYARRVSEFKKYKRRKEDSRNKNKKLQQNFIEEFFNYFNEYFSDWKKVVNNYKTKRSKFYRTNKVLLNVYIFIRNL